MLQGHTQALSRTAHSWQTSTECWVIQLPKRPQKPPKPPTTPSKSIFFGPLAAIEQSPARLVLQPSFQQSPPQARVLEKSQCIFHTGTAALRTNVNAHNFPFLIALAWWQVSCPQRSDDMEGSSQGANTFQNTFRVKECEKRHKWKQTTFLAKGYNENVICVFEPFKITLQQV